MAFYITQPLGVGAGADNEALDDAWVGKEIEIHASIVAGASYLHTLLDKPGDSAAALTLTAAQVAKITPDVTGTLRIQTRTTTSATPPAVSYVTRVIRVKRSSTGVLLSGGICPTAFGELPSEANYGANARGYVAQHEDNWRALASGVGAGASVQPSSDTTGVTDRAAWQAVLGAGGTLRPAPGAYYIDAPLVPTSGARLIGGDGVTVKAGSAWAGTSAVDPLNSLITCLEVEAAQAATAVATTAPMDSASIVVTSATGFASGEFFKIGGVSGAFDFYNQSASGGAPSEEVLEISDDYMSGTTIGLAVRSLLHHGANGSAKPVKLLTSIVDGFDCDGIRFEANGEIVHGAVYATFARRIRVRHCSARGVGGVVVRLRGCKNSLVHDLTDLGLNTAIVRFSSCQDTIARDCDASHEPGHVNFVDAGGAKPMPHFMWHSQCRGVQFVNCTSMDGVMGFATWGGVQCKMVNCAALRADVSPLLEMDDIDGAQLGLGPTEFGIRSPGLDMGGNSVDPAEGSAEFGFSNEFEFREDGCHVGAHLAYLAPESPDRYHPVTVYLHDQYRTKLNIRGSNYGPTHSTAARQRLLGALSVDFEAVSGLIDLQGVYGGLALSGTYSQMRNVDVNVRHISGAGAVVGLFALYLAGGLGAPLRSLTCPEDSFNPIMVGELSDSGTLYRECIIEYAFCDFAQTTGLPLKARQLVIARRPDAAAAPVVGVAYKLDTAGAAFKRDCTAANAVVGEPAIVCVSDPNQAYQSTTRYFVGVEIGPGATYPILALGALAPGEPLMLDANGKAVALADGAGATATIQRHIGNNSTLTTGAAMLQVGQ